jgi:hypothetical protein
MFETRIFALPRDVFKNDRFRSICISSIRYLLRRLLADKIFYPKARPRFSISSLLTFSHICQRFPAIFAEIILGNL